MQVETMLNEEIAKELEELGKMELGTDAYRATVDGICKMTDTALFISVPVFFLSVHPQTSKKPKFQVKRFC